MTDTDIYIIRDEIVANAVCCRMVRACLTSNTVYPVCDVVDERVGSCVVVQPKKYYLPCGYHYEVASLNGEHISCCFCPVRREIFLKYHK